MTFGELLSDSCLPRRDDSQQSAAMMAFETILNCSPFAFLTLCFMKIPECQGDTDQALLEDSISTVKVVSGNKGSLFCDEPRDEVLNYAE
jgi:hypothetical protein